MIRISLYLLFFGLLLSCRQPKAEEPKAYFHSVTGTFPIDSLGLTLIHEHILVDFIGVDSISPDRWNRDSVVAKVLPYLLEVKKYGVKTILDCTPSFLAKDPLLLKELSEKSGIRILTNTGYYGAVEGKYPSKNGIANRFPHRNLENGSSGS